MTSLVMHTSSGGLSTPPARIRGMLSLAVPRASLTVEPVSFWNSGMSFSRKNFSYAPP